MIFFKRFKLKHLKKKLKVLQHSRLQNQPSDSVLRKEMGYYHALASLYLSLIGNKHYPYAEALAMESYRTSAAIDDSKAQFILGKYYLEEARCREQLETDGLLASSSNQSRMQHRYKEGHVYLEAALKLGHIQAKRLYGLCHINGWGMEIDQDKGFDLIFESIEQENSWDKVPQIFAAMDLNKPEFFAALMKRRPK